MPTIRKQSIQLEQFHIFWISNVSMIYCFLSGNSYTFGGFWRRYVMDLQVRRKTFSL